MRLYNWNTLDTALQQSLLKRPVEKNITLKDQVQEIIDNVKEKGDDALKALTQRYDGACLSDMQVTEDEFQRANNQVTEDQLKPIKIAVERISGYQRQCFPKNINVDTDDGITCCKIPRPIERVGLYVPGGTAPLISTLMMLALPAKIAGCPMRILSTPANATGDINPLLLVTAKLCGINRVFKLGGAQAIAAMAYGTESVTKVDKIYGPGNTWVTTAKNT